MALIIEDRVLETSTTTGIGAYTLAGNVTGYIALSSVCANNDTAYYYAEDVNTSGVPIGNWEVGLGTWGTGNIFTRTTVHRSSNANAAVSWAAGTRRVAMALTSTQLKALGVVLSDDTTTNANTFYPVLANNQTSGTASAMVVSSTKLAYNPSTGTLSSVVFNSTSDENAKDNIRPIGYGLEEVLLMDGKKFEMKDSGVTSIGLIAQQVLPIIPEVVGENGDGKLGINYPVLVAVLVEAIKELNGRIVTLENR